MLCVFENKVPRRIFEPKRGEVRRGWKNVHNEEHFNLYFSYDIVRNSRNAYNMLV
jgi:hypothetical protein